MLEIVPGTGFSVFASPSAEAIVVGQNSTYLVSTDAAAAFNGTVSLSASGTPMGVTVSFNPGSITGIGSTTMEVDVASTVPPGSYSFTVSGSSGAIQASATVGLIVLEAPTQSGSGCSVGFVFNPSPPPAGQPMAITATLQGLAPGNTGSESVSLDHQLPGQRLDLERQGRTKSCRQAFMRSSGRAPVPVQAEAARLPAARPLPSARRSPMEASSPSMPFSR